MSCTRLLAAPPCRRRLPAVPVQGKRWHRGNWPVRVDAGMLATGATWVEVHFHGGMTATPLRPNRNRIGQGAAHRWLLNLNGIHNHSTQGSLHCTPGLLLALLQPGAQDRCVWPDQQPEPLHLNQVQCISLRVLTPEASFSSWLSGPDSAPDLAAAAAALVCAETSADMRV